jgi:hypothetical protein
MTFNPEPDFIDYAAQIGASGRWGAVNKAIERLAKNPRSDNAWYVQLLASLCSKVFSEYLLLKKEYANDQDDDASLLAWRARNLLELSVWSEYCTKSKANARRLYEDAGLDVAEIYTTFQKWGKATAQDANFLEPFTNAKQELSERAASEGIEILDGSYKRVRDAAKECGNERHYDVIFKFLSKLAHPTAMQIMAPPDPAGVQIQRACFFRQGCVNFTGAFHALEGCLLTLADDLHSAS